MVAGVTAVGLVGTVLVTAGGGPAGAAEPNAQAVGRLLDGSAGGTPIEGIADLQDARATAPGQTSEQNPLNVKLGNQLDLPLSGVINIPSAPALDAGAVNQVASANLNGKSLGAAGAVANDGGANLGNNGSGEPTAAEINLTGAALGSAGGSVTLPGVSSVPGLPTGIPGASGLDALGGLTGSVHGVFARAATKAGGDVETPSSGIADIDLALGSPALGALFTQLKGLLGGANLGDLPITPPTGTTLPGGLGSGSPLGTILATLKSSLPADCALTDPTPSNIDFKNGVVIDVAKATISISVQKLLSTLLGKDISNLDTRNFDLVSFLVENLPKILSKGLSSVITGITDELNSQFKTCLSTLPAPLSTAVSTISDQLKAGQKQITDAIAGIGDQFSAAGGSGLAMLADGLKNLIDIGLNVQSGPGIEPKDTDYPFDTSLAATPNQSTDVVKGQTLVRAIEITVGKASGGSGLTVALANAAAGPSNEAAPAAASPTPAPIVKPATSVPTGIPAGQAGGSTGGGSPLLPLVAILSLMIVGGGSLLHLRQRSLRQN